MLARRGPPGLTVVLSDLLTPSWPAVLDRLPARGGDVAVVHVLAAEELHPELAGDLDLVDAETDERRAVSLSTDVLREFRQSTDAWLADVEGRCTERGVTYSRVLAGDDVEQVLFRTWRRQGLIR